MLLLQRWLREMGFVSELYAEHIHPEMEEQVHPLTAYRPLNSGEYVVYHHSIGSSVTDLLLDLQVRIVLIYHNVTPARFFREVDPALAHQMTQGRDQLALLRPQTVLALGVSTYNAQELSELGFGQTSVLPLALDEDKYDLPSNPACTDRFLDIDPLLLFVGRQVPNKKLEDLLKLLYYCKRVMPSAGLALAGSAWLSPYSQWLHEFAADLGLGDAVFPLGHVSQQDLVTCYRRADLYVSMSEHEGFGKPFIESMYLDLPILAYAAAGIPGTLGGAGILFYRKNYEALAELVDILLGEKSLLRRIVARQRERVSAFLEPAVRGTWQSCLDAVMG
jgi:glycosyltransferase involved in cell wall biosynthesis